MSFVNSAEDALLALIFHGTTWANIADDTVTTPATQFFLSLHIATPGEAGAQNTEEASYGSYARLAVARSVAGWSVAAGVVSNAAQLSWPESTSGEETVTFAGVGLDLAGAGTLIAYAAVTDPPTGILIQVGTTPRVEIGELTFTLD